MAIENQPIRVIYTSRPVTKLNFSQEIISITQVLNKFAQPIKIFT